MRTARLMIPPIALVMCLVLVAGCSAPPPSDSGIDGEVRIGPVSPVETIGTPASAPYSANLTIRREGGGRAVRVTSGEDGRFRVNLAPGIYIVEPEPGDPLPTAQPVTVTVEAHRFSSVVIDFDSGIR